jgi:hypothetical protein
MLPGLIASALLLPPPVLPGGPPPGPAVVHAQATQPGPSAPAELPAAPRPAPAAQPAAPMAAPASAPGPQPAGPPAPQRPSLRDDHLGPPDPVWIGGDFLTYWFKPAQVPVLVAGTPAGQSPTPLIGGRDYEFGPARGGRLEVGAWLDERHTVGVGVSGFLTEQRAAFTAVNSDATGAPLLSRPFIDALVGLPSDFLVSNPGLLVGGAFAAAGARLAGADLLVYRNLYYCRGTSFDFLVGGQYLDLDEYLAVTQVTRPINGGSVVLNNTVFSGPGAPALIVADRFRTRNQFWGGVLGFRGEYHLGPAFVCLTVRGGIGNNHQTVDIDGFSAVAAPGVPPLPGGLLAIQGANLGRQVINRMAVLSEVNVQAGLQVSEALRLTVGYDFLYVNRVARPADQIDPIINPRLVPTSTSFGTVSGPISPIRTAAQDDWYAHGFRVGMELRY